MPNESSKRVFKPRARPDASDNMPGLRRQPLLSNNYPGGYYYAPQPSARGTGASFAATEEHNREMLRLIGAAQVAAAGGKKQKLKQAVDDLIKKRDKIRDGAGPDRKLYHTANKAINAENSKQIKKMIRKGGKNSELIEMAHAVIAANQGKKMDYMDIAEKMFKPRPKQAAAGGGGAMVVTEKKKKEGKDKKKKNNEKKKGKVHASFLERLLDPVKVNDKKKVNQTTAIGKMVSLFMANTFGSASKKGGPFRASQFNPSTFLTPLLMAGGDDVVKTRIARSLRFMVSVNKAIQQIAMGENKVDVRSILYEALSPELQRDVESHIKKRVAAAFSREYYDDTEFPEFDKPRVDDCVVNKDSFIVFNKQCFKYALAKTRAKLFFHVNVNGDSIHKITTDRDVFKRLGQPEEMAVFNRGGYSADLKPPQTPITPDEFNKYADMVAQEAFFEMLSDAFNFTHGMLRTMCSVLCVPFRTGLLQKFHQITMHIFTASSTENYDDKFESMFYSMLESIMGAVESGGAEAEIKARISTFLDSECDFVKGVSYKTVIHGKDYRSSATGALQALVWNKLLQTLKNPLVEAMKMDPFTGLPGVRSFNANAGGVKNPRFAIMKPMRSHIEHYIRQCIFELAFGSKEDTVQGGETGGQIVMNYKKYAMHFADQQGRLTSVLRKYDGKTTPTMQHCNSSGVFIFPIGPVNSVPDVGQINTFMVDRITDFKASVGLSKESSTASDVLSSMIAKMEVYEKTIRAAEDREDTVKLIKQSIVLPSTKETKSKPTTTNRIGGGGGVVNHMLFITEGDTPVAATPKPITANIRLPPIQRVPKPVETTVVPLDAMAPTKYEDGGETDILIDSNRGAQQQQQSNPELPKPVSSVREPRASASTTAFFSDDDDID
jgi:hypothetical protein